MMMQGRALSVSLGTSFNGRVVEPRSSLGVIVYASGQQDLILNASLVADFCA
jgi:hypothetical protein